MLALGLLTPHAMLVMDEPFDGFDLRQTRDIADVLRREAATGRTLALAIHQLADAERVCDRFILLADGRIRGAGTLNDLQVQTGLQREVWRTSSLRSHEMFRVQDAPLRPLLVKRAVGNCQWPGAVDHAVAGVSLDRIQLLSGHVLVRRGKCHRATIPGACAYFIATRRGAWCLRSVHPTSP